MLNRSYNQSASIDPSTYPISRLTALDSKILGLDQLLSLRGPKQLIDSSYDLL